MFQVYLIKGFWHVAFNLTEFWIVTQNSGQVAKFRMVLSIFPGNFPDKRQWQKNKLDSNETNIYMLIFIIKMTNSLFIHSFDNNSWVGWSQKR